MVSTPLCLGAAAYSLGLFTGVPSVEVYALKNSHIWFVIQMELTLVMGAVAAGIGNCIIPRDRMSKWIEVMKLMSMVGMELFAYTLMSFILHSTFARHVCKGKEPRRCFVDGTEYSRDMWIHIASMLLAVVCILFLLLMVLGRMSLDMLKERAV